MLEKDLLTFSSQISSAQEAFDYILNESLNQYAAPFTPKLIKFSTEVSVKSLEQYIPIRSIGAVGIYILSNPEQALNTSKHAINTISNIGKAGIYFVKASIEGMIGGILLIRENNFGIKSSLKEILNDFENNDETEGNLFLQLTSKVTQTTIENKNTLIIEDYYGYDNQTTEEIPVVGIAENELFL